MGGHAPPPEVVDCVADDGTPLVYVRENRQSGDKHPLGWITLVKAEWEAIKAKHGARWRRITCHGKSRLIRHRRLPSGRIMSLLWAVAEARFPDMDLSDARLRHLSDDPYDFGPGTVLAIDMREIGDAIIQRERERRAICPATPAEPVTFGGNEATARLIALQKRQEPRP